MFGINSSTLLPHETSTNILFSVMKKHKQVRTIQDKQHECFSAVSSDFVVLCKSLRSLWADRVFSLPRAGHGWQGHQILLIKSD
jgi:hypothetical protein